MTLAAANHRPRGAKWWVILDPVEVLPDQTIAANSGEWFCDPARDGGRCAGSAIPLRSVEQWSPELARLARWP